MAQILLNYKNCDGSMGRAHIFAQLMFLQSKKATYI